MRNKIKLQERQLYTTWIDLHYANILNKDFVHDIEMQLKEAKKHQNKTFIKKSF